MLIEQNTLIFKEKMLTLINIFPMKIIGIYKWKLHIFLFFFSGVCQLFFYSTFFLSNEKNKLTSNKTMWEIFKNSQFHSVLKSVDYANLWTSEFISKYCPI